MENEINTAVVADNQIDLFSTFYVQNNIYGIRAIKVQEVINVGHITPVHQQTKPFIVGIINLRGRIVTIIDLAEKLGLEKTKIEKDTGIFILDYNNEYVGLLVDKIGDVLQIDTALIAPAPGNIQGISGKYFDGVYQAENKLIALLNPDLVLITNEEK
ncbi:MAG: chemotaxis protein CheW [Deltaproteobacteria bacterium]|jgi:purine-binding chemotaxis protein CheW|nr:chemotaxis protein CheW [Deltaproteobacteria bacterium]